GALAFAAGTPAASAAEPRARSIDATALSFAIEPARLVLGDTTAATVTLTAKNRDGTPLDVAPPILTVSTGALSAPTRTGAGVWTVTFTPPKEAFPHVAIVAATIETATSSAVGFVPLHLWGKGETAVRTKPNSTVTVMIGSDSHGPVQADKTGLAKVPLVVPPGPERAVARSVDEVGNESQKTIDLGVPAFNRVALLALDDPVAADGGSRGRLLAFVVDKKGEPLFSARLKAKASVGAFGGEPVGVAPGVFLVAWQPGKAAPGTAKVSVTLDGAPGSTAVASVTLISGGPAKAVFTLSRNSLTADDERVVETVLHLFDGAGSAVPASAATVDVDYGRIDAISTLPDGTRRINWLIPPQTERTEVTITARVPSGAVLGDAKVALASGKPARAYFDKPEGVVADGQSGIELVLHVVDRAGNELTANGARIEVEARVGRVEGGAVDGKRFVARLIPAANDHPDFVRVTGSVGAVTAETLVKTAPRPAAWLLVGAGLAVGSNYGALASAGPDLSLLVRLPGLDGSLHAGVSASVLQSVLRPSPVLDQRSYPIWAEVGWRP
ncbi:MAG: hypothetical protein A2138_01275, partial [Deltaproteobacteria bacterium RBG_16_71_12]